MAYVPIAVHVALPKNSMAVHFQLTIVVNIKQHC